MDNFQKNHEGDRENINSMLGESIRRLQKSVINFRKGNEDMSDLINQLIPVLNNVEKTLDIVEEKYSQILERKKSGGEVNPIILEKFIENLENLTHVIDNVKKITKNLELEINKHMESVSKLNTTINKLKLIDSEMSRDILSEFKRASLVIQSNKEKLNELIIKNQILENRLKELLLEIDNMINSL